MSGFVYLWHDKKHSKFYIGSHWGTEVDGYVCGSSWMGAAYKKRPQDFKRRIIARVQTSVKELHEEEQRWLNMIDSNELGERYYNLKKWAAGGHGGANRGCVRSTEVREMVAEKLRGRKHSVERRLKNSLAQKGKRKSDSWYAKMAVRPGNRNPKRKAQCPHCSLIGGRPQMLRWHFDNCKQAKEQ